MTANPDTLYPWKRNYLLGPPPVIQCKNCDNIYFTKWNSYNAMQPIACPKCQAYYLTPPQRTADETTKTKD